MMSCKTSNMQRVIHMAQRVAQKTCSRVCQLFCCPIDALLCEKVTCCHETTDDTTTQVALQNPPSTILILNISNSTLIDCVIGNDTYPSAAAENRPLMRESELQMQAESLRVNIHNSRLNCVIIGDNNYMHAEQTHSTETQDPQV